MINCISQSLKLRHPAPLPSGTSRYYFLYMPSLGQCSIPMGVWKHGLCFAQFAPYVCGFVGIWVYLWLGSSHCEVVVLTLSQGLGLFWEISDLPTPKCQAVDSRNLIGGLNKWKLKTLNPTNSTHDNPNPLPRALWQPILTWIWKTNHSNQHSPRVSFSSLVAP